MLDVLLHDNVNDVGVKVGKVSILFVSNYRNLLKIRITTSSYFKVKTKTGSISFLEPYHLLSLSIVRSLVNNDKLSLSCDFTFNSCHQNRAMF